VLSLFLICQRTGRWCVAVVCVHTPSAGDDKNKRQFSEPPLGISDDECDDITIRYRYRPRWRRRRRRAVGENE